MLKKYKLSYLILLLILFSGCAQTAQPTPLPEPFSFPPPNIETPKPNEVEEKLIKKEPTLETKVNIKTEPSKTITSNNGTIEQLNNTTTIIVIPPETVPETTDAHLKQTYITSTLQVNDTVYEVTLQWPSTAYDQLVKASVAGHITFRSINYGALGNMVDEINGMKNSTAIKKYWIYYINGKKAQIGASQYFIQKGDVIRWHYEDEE